MSIPIFSPFVSTSLAQFSNHSTGKNIAEKSKLFASAVVSGINNFNESFTIISFIIFGTLPDILSFIGYGIIFMASLYMFIYNKKLDKVEKV